MASLTFKTKILLLVIIPLILVSLALTLLSVHQAQKLGDQNVDSFSKMIFELRRGELKNYTEIALSAAQHVYENVVQVNRDAAKKAAVEVLRDLEYGEDGYFFSDDFDGNVILHPKKPFLEGKNIWDIQDPNGVYLVRSLVEQSKKIEGGYTEYMWDKPSKGREVGKISYSNSFGDDGFEWMVGTGLYIDDLEEAVFGVKKEVSQNITSTLKLIAGLALLCTIVVGLIGARFTMSEGKLADEKLQELSRKAVEGQEEERSRVARDLQKGINKALHATRVKLKEVAKGSNLGNDDARKNFITAVSILDKTIDEVYRISGELRPEILDKSGLYPAVDALVNKISTNSEVNITFKRAGSIERLRNELETSIYRIIQEAIHNITAHAQATSANIRMHQTASAISINIQDDGVGFDTKAVLGKKGRGSVGFTDMRVRAESLGGTFNVFSSKDIGTVIKVHIPL
ncbi:MAG: cache domain-containing protein [Cellvibrionaceae bacterium]